MAEGPSVANYCKTERFFFLFSSNLLISTSRYLGISPTRVRVYVFRRKNASHKSGHYSTHTRTIETWNTALCSQEQQGDWVFSVSLFFFSLKITSSKKIVCFKVIRRRRPVFRRSRTRLISRATEVDGRRTAYQQNR